MQYNENNVLDMLFKSNAPYIYDGKGNCTFKLRALAILLNDVLEENKPVRQSTELSIRTVKKALKEAKLKEQPKINREEIRQLDWKKACALKMAGWSNADIALELKTEERYVDLFMDKWIERYNERKRKP